MPQASSKGLLPQLTEVLLALTASHELLLRKVRTVQLERTDDLAPAQWRGAKSAVPTPMPIAVPVAILPGSKPLATAVLPLPRGVSIAGDPPIPAGRPMLPAGRPMLVDARAIASTPAPLSAPPETGSVEPTTVGPPAALSRSRLVAQSGSGDEPSRDRDYNYFDELDARLADLGNPDPAINVPASHEVRAHPDRP